jgi:hypothetical protein
LLRHDEDLYLVSFVFKVSRSEFFRRALSPTRDEPKTRSGLETAVRRSA